MAVGAVWSKVFGARSRGNYPYVTARVRAKKPKLIRPEEIQKLLQMDADQIARFIGEGEYKREVEELGGKYAGARLVEVATRLKLSRSYRDILSYSQGELAELITLYLARYDVYNIKTILRGLRTNASDEEISRALIPAGALSAESLAELAKLEDFESAVKALEHTPFGNVLRQGMETGGLEALAKLENDLDKRYYRLLIDSVKPDSEPKRAFLAYLKREVDVINLRTLVRLKLDDVDDGEEFLLPEAKDVTPEFGRRLLRAPKEEFVQSLADTDLAPVADDIRKTFDTGDLEHTMDALESFLVKSGKTFGERYPLSILPIIDYILRLRFEVDDLRIIAVGKQTKLRPEVIEELITR